MLSLILLVSVAFLAAWVLTPVVCLVCRRAGWLDQPDSQRKLHQAAVPRLGGIVLAVSYVGSYLVLFAGPHSFGADLLGPHLGMVLALAPAAAIVLVTGLLDDLYGLSPRFRLVFEATAAMLAVAAGLSFGDAWWSAPATVVWLVAAANAFNLIDGVDGLATGVGLFATVTMLGAALVNGNYGLALATAPLAGALLGFLRYNFEPASIFLGDSGSLTLGFLLGCFALIWGYKSTAAVGMTAPLILLFLPFLDVGLSVVRRFLTMKPIFGADRGHIHHRLLARGLRPRHVALIAYAACGVAAAVSMIHSSAPPLYGAIVLGAFALLVWLAVAKLSYAEFRATYRTLWTGQIRRVVRQEILLDQFRNELAAARSEEEFWDRLCDTSRQMGLEEVYLRLGNRDRVVRLRAPDPTHVPGAGAAPGASLAKQGENASAGGALAAAQPAASLPAVSPPAAYQPATYQTTVPLQAGDYVAFTGHAADPSTAQYLLPLAAALRDALTRQTEPDRPDLPAPVAAEDQSARRTAH